MPCYNCEKYIDKAIESVKNQTYNQWELLIIDDLSTDKSLQIVDEYAKGNVNIDVIRLSKNGGAAYARNVGIKRSKGEFIAFLDADDVWTPEKLEYQINYMVTKKRNITCTSYGKIDENGIPNGIVIEAKEKVDYDRVLFDCPVGNSTVIYNAGVLGKIEIPNIRKRNDDALWLKMLKIEKYIYGIDKILCYYRVREKSLSYNKLNLIKYHWKLYREVERLGVLRSLKHIIIWIFIKLFKVKK